MSPIAQVIADSISPQGQRVSTLQVVFHRFVLAEVNTHRVFSRNSASSRAIPVGKQIRKVEQSPAIPVVWPAEQKGMQGGKDLSDRVVTVADSAWRNAADDMVIAARRLAALGVHKSVTNRLLEPFQMHTAVITATDWTGFFAQRCSPQAQPEIRVVAEAMRAALEDSTPTEIPEGFWHLPYVDRDTIADVEKYLLANEGQGRYGKDLVTHYLVQVSAARCARVSYETQGGVRDVSEDLDLYDRLVSARPAHWSPLEHPCTPWKANIGTPVLSFTDLSGMQQVRTPTVPLVGNLLGWRQHRFEMEAAT